MPPSIIAGQKAATAKTCVRHENQWQSCCTTRRFASAGRNPRSLRQFKNPTAAMEYIMGYKHIQVPGEGDKITVNEDFSLNVPNNPIIPYIEGDGIGVDISPS